jgi:hypothetical protein
MHNPAFNPTNQRTCPSLLCVHVLQRPQRCPMDTVKLPSSIFHLLVCITPPTNQRTCAFLLCAHVLQRPQRCSMDTVKLPSSIFHLLVCTTPPPALPTNARVCLLVCLCIAAASEMFNEYCKAAMGPAPPGASYPSVNPADYDPWSQDPSHQFHMPCACGFDHIAKKVSRSS